MSSRQKCPASNSMSLQDARESGLLDLWHPRRTKQNQVKSLNRQHKQVCPRGGQHECRDSAEPRLMSGEVRSMGVPFPPSVNNYWHRSQDGGMHISKKGREFIDTVAALVGANRWGGLVGNALCEVALVLVPPDRKVPHDADNYCKALLDALTKARVWIDDVQVKHLRIAMLQPDGQGARAEVAVRLHSGHVVSKASQLFGSDV